MKAFLSFIFLSVALSGSAIAQSEVEIERNSLAGINRFGVVVNIEQPQGLEVENLNPGLIRARILEAFEGIPASILSYDQLRESYDHPFLHVHVNIMRAANNTYPFAVEIRFYQPVKLSLKRNTEIMAATWHSGYVGIVSSDLLTDIAPTVVSTAEDFSYEFLQVN